MNMRDQPTTDLDPFSLTIEQIDNELSGITAAGPTTIAAVAADLVAPEVLARLRTRHQLLADAREVAVARVRMAQAAQDRVIRERFDALASDVVIALHTQASAIDVWIQDGERLLESYRTTEGRLVEFKPLLVEPPKPGREVEAAMLRQALILDAHLERQLATVGVLPHLRPTRTSNQADFTFERYVVTRLDQFLNEIRQRLPGIPTDERVIQLPLQEKPHHG